MLKLEKQPSGEPKRPPESTEAAGVEQTSEIKQPMENSQQYFMDMINLRKKLKKEEDQRKLFAEQAKKKDEELRKVQQELEREKDSKQEETDQ